MPDQLSLLGPDPQPALFQPETIDGSAGRLRGYKLFLAIFPQPEVVQGVTAIGAALRLQHGLRGTLHRPERLHLTLAAIADFHPGAVNRLPIDASLAAAAGVSCPALPLVFDQAGSFQNRGRPDNNAFVLRCDAASDDAVARMQQALLQPLRRLKLHPQPSSTPHMTLLYDSQVVPAHPIEPLRWVADRFALILSHQGLGHHQWLGQWPLG